MQYLSTLLCRLDLVAFGSLLASLVPASAVAAEVSDLQVCQAPPGQAGSRCTPSRIYHIDPQGRLLWVTAQVELPRRSEPQAVFLSASASSKIHWDGKLIGSNGSPAANADDERPGLRDAAIPIPVDAAAPGRHRLTLEMSSGHGLLRLDAPVTEIRVGDYEGPRQRLVRDYLPALLTAGGLLIAAAYFGLSFLFGQGSGAAACLAAAALLATGQLAAEASRAFVSYAYPAHILRLCLILGFAAAFGLALVGYAAKRFELRYPALLLALQGALSAAAVVLASAFDDRTALVLVSATGIAAAAAADGLGRSRPGALPILIVFVMAFAAASLAPYSFLDRDLYLWTIMLFVVLFADHARHEREPAPEEMSRTASSERLPLAQIALGSAGSQRFLLPQDILRLSAADDYTEVFVAGGKPLLHPEPLQKLLARLPNLFLQVHRSHAINLAHLRSFEKGPRSSVRLSDDSIAPVSRRRVQSLVEALSGGADPGAA